MSSLSSPSPAGTLPAEPAWQSLPAHPRLFANAQKWEQLRARISTDAVSGQLFEIQRLSADSILGQPPVALVREGRRLLTPMRQAIHNISILASVARLTGERRYVDRALLEMRAIASLEDWNPTHYLDTSEGAMALAIGYDWLYQDLSQADRQLCEEALLRKALVVSFAPDHQDWVSRTNNWNQVCHGGMVAAAIAVADRDPALARRTVQRALDNLPLVAGLYAPDGAYVEGPVYWEYGTTYHVLLIEALRNIFGSAFGLDALPGFMASADYIAQMNTPNGHLFNYADTNEREYGSMPVLFWFAGQREQRGILRRELSLLGPILDQAREGNFRLNSRFTPFELLWRQTPAAGTQAAAALPLHWYAAGETPIAVHRSAWNDPSATYVGLKGGSPTASHGHMDVGSFVLESDGIVWAVDPGQQNYASIEAAGVGLWDSSQESNRWNIFRIGPDSHTIIRFNRAPQLVEGRSELVKFRADGDNPCTILDLTSLYKDQVTKVRRGISLRRDRTVLIQDEWSTGDKPADVVWQWMTRAEVAIYPDGILLEQDGKSLRLRILATEQFAIGIEDVSEPIHPYEDPNPGLKRIVIRIATAPNATARLLVTASRELSNPAAADHVEPLDAW